MIPHTTNDNTPLAVVSFVGDDAANFLQGQLSNDVQTLGDGGWQRTAYCSPKGRMIANGLLGKTNGDFYFIVRQELAPLFAARISRFVLRAKVKVNRRAATVTATTDLADSKNSASARTLQKIGDTLVFYDENEQLRARFLSTTEAAETADSPPDAKSTAPWLRRQIMAGVPWVGATTGEMFIPQFVNFELLGGVSFNKGCYVGQEVIARLHYLGKVKRRGYIARGVGAPPMAGDSLANETGKPAAEVVDAVADESGGFIALISLQSAAMQTNILHNNEKITLTKPSILADE